MPPLSPEAAKAMLEEIDVHWALDPDASAILRTFEFPGFARTIAFVNAIAWVATVEGHHPVLEVRYGSVQVKYTTTAIDGLSENDFICAAKIDRLAAEQ